MLKMSTHKAAKMMEARMERLCSGQIEGTLEVWPQGPLRDHWTFVEGEQQRPAKSYSQSPGPTLIMAASAGVDGPKITIIEHCVFFKLKDGYTEDQENDMYKGLWSFKDRYGSIMAMSLGRTMIGNADGVTHVLYMRFPTKEALATYLNDGYRIDISYKYIVPIFHGELVCDFEAEMETDLAALYREGESFEHGLEHVELFKVKEGTSLWEVEEVLSAFSELPKKAGTRIAQLTAGVNYTAGQKYTFGLVARLPSVEALGTMLEDRAYQEILERCYPILEDHLQAAYSVDDSLARVDEPYSRSAVGQGIKWKEKRVVPLHWISQGLPPLCH